jgi:hypothetical protein
MVVARGYRLVLAAQSIHGNQAAKKEKSVRGGEKEEARSKIVPVEYGGLALLVWDRKTRLHFWARAFSWASED